MTAEEIEASETKFDRRFFTEEEYLATEPDRLERHEFFDGSIRAMAGASENHEEVAGELYARLRAFLKGKPCKVFKGDMKLRSKGKYKNSPIVFYYPDVMIVCDPSDDHQDYKTKPKVIVEVLSRDRGRDLVEKLAIYKEIESVDEYFVVGQNAERPEVHIFKRSNNFEADVIHEGPFTLDSIGLTLEVKDLYEF